MITPEQIRAARALLDWKQSELAEKSGLSLPSINNIERMIGSPRLSTLTTLRKTFENHGIEFIGLMGVQKHSDIFVMKEFHGDDFLEKLNDDLLSCMRSNNDIVMMFGLDERQYPKYPEQMLRHYRHQLATGFIEHILLTEGDNFFLSPVESYRWTPLQTAGLVPYYVYHDRVALIMWDKKRSIIIRSKDIAETYRSQFEYLWEQAKPIPVNSVNLLDDPAYRGNFEKK